MHICWTAWRAAISSSHITLLCRLFRIPIKHKRSGNSMNMSLFSKKRFVKRCTIVGSTWWLTCFTDSWAFKTLFSVDSARRWASSLETKMMTFNLFFRLGEIFKYGLACPPVRAKRCRPLVAFRLKFATSHIEVHRYRTLLPIMTLIFFLLVSAEDCFIDFKFECTSTSTIRCRQHNFIYYWSMWPRNISHL